MATLARQGRTAREGRRQVNALAVAALVIAVAGVAAGVILAVGMVRSGRDSAALERDSSVALRGPAAVGQDVPVSFGVVAVQSVTKSAGPTAKALAGVTHGIQSLVAPNRIQVQATVTVTNLRETVQRYNPAQFSLYATRGRRPGAADKPIPVARASVPPGTLQPAASIDAILTFVAPRNGSKLWIAFRDTGGRAHSPALVDLGRTDRTPAGALQHYHAHSR